MSSNSLEAKDVRGLAAGNPEVEFALVLARTIQSIQGDPEQLRSAIYELARQKLREQFADQTPAEITRMSKALEVAIQGVEAYSRKEEGERQGIPRIAVPSPPATRSRPAAPVVEPPSIDGPALDQPGRHVRSAVDSSGAVSRRRSRLGTLGRFALVAGIVLAVAAAVRFSKFNPFPKAGAPSETSAQISARAEQPVSTPGSPPQPKPTPLLPTTYGTYAISAGKLYELEPLPFRAPDIRVAVSALITTPSKTILPDGHLRFIVFRRDATGSTPDQIDVRIVAKVRQSTTFDAAGKPTVSKADDEWVIRNIAFPYRTAPVKDNVETYEVQSKEPDAELAPGRYALVIKGQAYDFTIEGTVTDDRQCLGKLSASNGTFYSACQKLP